MQVQVQAHPVHQSWISYAVTIGIVVVVMALRIKYQLPGQMHFFGIGIALWGWRAVYAVVAGLMFFSLPPVGWVAVASLAGLAAGAAVGWQRGKMMRIEVDPETHALNQKASPTVMFFLIALIIVRAGARSLLGAENHVSPAMLTDPLIAFALGMFTLQRIEMYLRARRLLEEVRGRA